MEVSRENLIKQLESNNIDLTKWGKDNAKTVDHLLRELELGESSLEQSERGLLRVLSAVSVSVFYADSIGRYKLVEDRQEFKDGRVRRRTHLDGSVSEKMLPDELPLSAASRALLEELGIYGNLDLQRESDEFVTRTSQSFPDLLSQYRTFKFSITLFPDQYRKEGYIEYQEDKTTYFVWTKRN